MIQKIDSFYKSLQSFSCVVKNDNLYFYTKFHELVEMNLITYNTQFLKSNQTKKCDAVYGIFCILEEIYYIDGEGTQIVEEKTGRTIPLLFEREQGVYVLFSTQYHDKICVLYSNGLLFCEINVEDGSYEVIDLNSQLHINDINAGSIDCIGVYEDIILIFQERRKHLISYNIKKKIINETPLPSVMKKVIHFACRDGEIIALNQSGEIYIWNVIDHSINLAWAVGEGKRNFIYGRCHIFKDKIILLPNLLGEEILILDNKFHFVERYNNYPDDFSYIMEDQYKYIRYTETDKDIIYPMRSANYILRISKDSGNIRWLKPKIECIQRMMTCYQKEHPTAIFLPDGIMNFNSEKIVGETGGRKTIGNKIWRQTSNKD